LKELKKLIRLFNLKKRGESPARPPSNQGNEAEDDEEYVPASNMFVKMPLQSNLLNPYLYDDYRIYRESYKTGNHGMPNPNAKKYYNIDNSSIIIFNFYLSFTRPHRGDFAMHPEWHPRLYHHRLPYNH
jgi:hypothetical protein